VVKHNYAFGGCGVTPSIPRGKSRIDVYLTAEREKRFKEEVFKRKGMKKGNISEAVEEAISLWINAEPSKTVRRKED
jgi:hypothetical protein